MKAENLRAKVARLIEKTNCNFVLQQTINKGAICPMGSLNIQYTSHCSLMN